MTPPGEASQPQLAVLKLSQRSEQVRPGAARRYFRNGEGVDQIEAAEDLTEARYGIEIGSPGQAVELRAGCPNRRSFSQATSQGIAWSMMSLRRTLPVRPAARMSEIVTTNPQVRIRLARPFRATGLRSLQISIWATRSARVRGGSARVCLASGAPWRAKAVAGGFPKSRKCS